MNLARQIAEHGHYLSIPANARRSKLHADVADTPTRAASARDRLSYLSPTRDGRNEPATVAGTAAYAAELWGVSQNEVENRLTETLLRCSALCRKAHRGTRRPPHGRAGGAPGQGWRRARSAVDWRRGGWDARRTCEPEPLPARRPLARPATPRVSTATTACRVAARRARWRSRRRSCDSSCSSARALGWCAGRARGCAGPTR